MIQIDILEETNSLEEMAEVLEVIASMIKAGFTKGYDPNWDINGYEEKIDI